MGRGDRSPARRLGKRITEGAASLGRGDTPEALSHERRPRAATPWNSLCRRHAEPRERLFGGAQSPEAVPSALRDSFCGVLHRTAGGALRQCPVAQTVLAALRNSLCGHRRRALSGPQELKRKARTSRKQCGTQAEELLRKPIGMLDSGPLGQKAAASPR